MIKTTMMKKLFICLAVLVSINTMAETPLVILHTNDTHSQLEPYTADDKRNADKAGILRREALYRDIRSKDKNVLIFDAGDFVQGTPYFNLFKGEAEVKLMNYLKLDCITLGNHEFDNGIEFLDKIIKKAKFPVVCSNYDMSAVSLGKRVKRWLIINKYGLKIGIVSANISPFGLISPSNFKGIKYLEPLETAEKYAFMLKNEKKCDLVICISHLGLEYEDYRPSDLNLAKSTRSIDVIIGGHTHTFMSKPLIVKNIDNKDVIINQVGKGGIYAGKLDLIVR
jgi:5'-nucleotidase